MGKELKESKKPVFYPVTIMLIGLVVVVFLMIKVVPTFRDVFVSVGGKLPAPTMFLISVSNFLNGNEWAIVLFVPLYYGLKALFEKGLLKVWMVMVFFGLSILFIVVAMFLPMFELGDVVGNSK
jgi:type II secretory pathway component PulF